MKLLQLIAHYNAIGCWFTIHNVDNVLLFLIKHTLISLFSRAKFFKFSPKYCSAKSIKCWLINVIAWGKMEWSKLQMSMWWRGKLENALDLYWTTFWWNLIISIRYFVAVFSLSLTLSLDWILSVDQQHSDEKKGGKNIHQIYRSLAAKKTKSIQIKMDSKTLIKAGNFANSSIKCDDVLDLCFRLICLNTRFYSDIYCSETERLRTVGTFWASFQLQLHFANPSNAIFGQQ